MEVLCLDHIDNNGCDERARIKLSGESLCRYLMANDYPAGIQVLCFNCNMKKEFARRKTKAQIA